MADKMVQGQCGYNKTKARYTKKSHNSYYSNWCTGENRQDFKYFVCFVLFCFAFMTDQLTHDKHTWVLGGKQDLNGVSRLLAAVTPGWGGLESPSSFAENR